MGKKKVDFLTSVCRGCLVEIGPDMAATATATMIDGDGAHGTWEDDPQHYSTFAIIERFKYGLLMGLLQG